MSFPTRDIIGMDRQYFSNADVIRVTVSVDVTSLISNFPAEPPSCNYSFAYRLKICIRCIVTITPLPYVTALRLMGTS